VPRRVRLECLHDLIPRVDAAGAAEFTKVFRQQIQERAGILPGRRGEQVRLESEQELLDGPVLHFCRIQRRHQWPARFSSWFSGQAAALLTAGPAGIRVAAGHSQPVMLIVLSVEPVPSIVEVEPVLESDGSELEVLPWW
jgi:hypothetical protein